ncbi:13675_t:CDS:2, partial [Rhizophagus irregularis]
NKTYSSKPVYYIDQIRSGNVYTSTVKKKVDKRIEFSNTISVAKTSVQIAVMERLNINEVQETFSYNVTKNNCQQQSLEPLVIVDNNSISEISNPKYHKPKGRPSKRYKSQMEMT